MGHPGYDFRPEEEQNQTSLAQGQWICKHIVACPKQLHIRFVPCMCHKPLLREDPVTRQLLLDMGVCEEEAGLLLD